MLVQSMEGGSAARRFPEAEGSKRPELNETTRLFQQSTFKTHHESLQRKAKVTGILGGLMFVVGLVNTVYFSVYPNPANISIAIQSMGFMAVGGVYVGMAAGIHGSLDVIERYMELEERNFQ